MKSIIIKSFKMLGITILSIIGLIIIIGLLFINISPEFGGKSTVSKKKHFETTDHYEEGKFINQIETNLDMKIGDMYEVMKGFIVGVPNRKPQFDIPVQHVDSLTLEKDQSVTQLIWFGHSAFLLQMDGKNILLDPMFGDVPAPHPLLGNSRYSSTLPIEIEKLPHIDAIVISHDHYDHLDYGSIQKLKSKTNKFYVPLGVGAHFQSWGIDSNDIVELDWWERSQLGPIELVFTPSRHFSGRGLTDRNNTLWGSWVINGISDKIYFSGDSGYGPHFKEIGDKYGPFDFAMIECGQYDPKWSQIHMMPEESAQAGKDVRAKQIMPIHWGAFSLALHPWTDPVERILKKSQELNINVITPQIGEFITLDSHLSEFHTKWWQK
jgi:L-ascorbate metabolism protein UlaG (beta-lactamase superfamily)